MQLSHWIHVALVLEILFGKSSSFCLHFQTSLPVLNLWHSILIVIHLKEEGVHKNLIKTEKD